MATHVFVTADLLGVRPGGMVRLGAGTIETSPGRPGKAVIPVEFQVPGGDSVQSVEIQITEPAIGEDRIGFTVVSAVQATNPKSGPARIERTRDVSLHEGVSILHQAYEDPMREASLVVSLTAETRVVPELAIATKSEPIVFRVALSHATASGSVPLETNVLRTLESSPVSYAFKTEGSAPPADGAGGAAEAEDARSKDIELTLLPSRSSEGVCIVDVTISGRQSVGDARKDRAVLVHKTQVVSRGAGDFELSLDDGAAPTPGSYVFSVHVEF